MYYALTDKPDTISPGWGRSVLWSMLITAFGITIALAIAFNYLVDPFELYGGKLLPVRHVNDYVSKLTLYREFQPRPDVVIFGSSKVMTFEPGIVDELTERRCFNFWLPGAGAETYYAVLHLLLEENRIPIDTIIIGVGVETIHPVFPIQPEARYAPEISRHFIYDPQFRGGIIDRICLLFTMDQTIQSILKLTSFLFGPNRGRPVDVDLPELDYREDGFTAKTLAEAKITNGTYDLDAAIDNRLRRKRYTDQSMAIAGWTGITGTRRAYWEDFLDLCEERSIQLYVFMTPGHPRLWELMDGFDAGPVFDQVSDFFSDTVTGIGGTYRDYRNVDDFGGDMNFFYDEIHMRPQNAELLMRNLLAEFSEGQDVHP